MPKTAAIIPARYASTRLPGKLIKSEARERTGKYLIEHVYGKVMEAKNVQEVIIATDDERIAEVVRNFGGCVKMTSINHSSGTDRVAEIASNLDVDFVVNIQGDEPDIKGSMIDDLIDAMYAEREAVVCTFANKIKTRDEFIDPNAVKVVIDKNGHAMYFSRASNSVYKSWNIPFKLFRIRKTPPGINTGNYTIFSFLKPSCILFLSQDFFTLFSRFTSTRGRKVTKVRAL